MLRLPRAATVAALVALVAPGGAAAHFVHPHQPVPKMSAHQRVVYYQRVHAHARYVRLEGKGRSRAAHATLDRWALGRLASARDAYELTLPPIPAIRAVFPASTEDGAIAIAGCETGDTYWPGATNGQFVNIFQMGLQERRDYGWHVAGSPPILAARAAFRYSRGGTHWGPWPECSAKLGLPR